MFDPARPAADLLAKGARQAKVTQPAGAAVYSLDALAPGPLTFSTAPQPVRGPALRPPAVAGSFYPAEPNISFAWWTACWRGSRGQEVWSAALVPHAGWQFFGRIAANVLKRLKIPRTVIILGPKHTAHGDGLGCRAAPDLDVSGRESGVRFHLGPPTVASDPRPGDGCAGHQREHAIEVELPFLARWRRRRVSWGWRSGRAICRGASALPRD